jgi:NAD(P) transhydrogenase subunit alpha
VQFAKLELTGQSPMLRIVFLLIAAPMALAPWASGLSPSGDITERVASADGVAASAPANDNRAGMTAAEDASHASTTTDYWSLAFVFVLSTFIGLGVIGGVSRLLHTPLMSLTNAISAIAVIGAIIVTGGDHPTAIRVLGAIALFASTTNIVSGFLITDRMLKMFKQTREKTKA